MLNFKKFSLTFLAETKDKTETEKRALFQAVWDKLDGWQRALLLKRWWVWRRDSQAEPKGFLVWLILGGRGAGKTRAGAEWIREQVKSGRRKIALVAANYTQARDVMLHGESGLLNIGHPSERPKFIASRRCLEWPCGATAQIFSAEAPDGLRGSQFDAAWADEFCAWNHGEETLSNLRLALRLDTPDGRPPQLVVTTTPRPSAELIELKAAKGVVTHTLRTAENAHHLARGFLETMEATYGGTPLGMQELEGQIVTEWPGALWSLSTIAQGRENTAPDLDRIVIALDPPTTSGPKSDACGIIVAGEKAGRAYVLQDATLGQATPEDWASRAVALFETYNADCIIAEGNQGGEMVESVLRQIAPNLPIQRKHARRSKTARAEPISHLYSRKLVSHVGRFDALEAQMCRMGSQAPPGRKPKSPDRVDALVWAIDALLMRGTGGARVRAV
jgi:phage terminase large subunit-like protein